MYNVYLYLFTLHTSQYNSSIFSFFFGVNTKLRWIQQFVVNGVVWSQLVGHVIALLLRGWSGIWVNIIFPWVGRLLQIDLQWLIPYNLLQANIFFLDRIIPTIIESYCGILSSFFSKSIHILSVVMILLTF